MSVGEVIRRPVPVIRRAWQAHLQGLLAGRRGAALCMGIIVLLNLPGLHRASDIPLKFGPDTPIILREVSADTSLPGLLRWFTTDWPLGNRLYRPLVTISFAADVTVFGDWARGYRLMNWLLATLTAMGLFAWLAGLGLPRPAGVLAAGLFSLQQASFRPAVGGWLVLAVGVPGMVLVLRDVLRAPGGRRAKAAVSSPGTLVLAALYVTAVEWTPLTSVVSWIATRTALLGGLLSVYALVAVAAYCRSGRAWPLVTGLVLAAGALCSYEQSVMLPLGAAAVGLALRGKARARLLVACALMAALLPGYLALRQHAVGGELSDYAIMQMKSGHSGPGLEMAKYALAPLYFARLTAVRVQDIWTVCDLQFLATSMLVAAGLVAYWRLLVVALRPAVALLAMKALLFAPMCVLHLLDHYCYLPELAGAPLAMGLLWPRGLSALGGPEEAEPESATDAATDGGDC